MTHFCSQPRLHSGRSPFGNGRKMTHGTCLSLCGCWWCSCSQQWVQSSPCVNASLFHYMHRCAMSTGPGTGHLPKGWSSVPSPAVHLPFIENIRVGGVSAGSREIWWVMPGPKNGACCYANGFGEIDWRRRKMLGWNSCCIWIFHFYSSVFKARSHLVNWNACDLSQTTRSLENIAIFRKDARVVAILTCYTISKCAMRPQCLHIPYENVALCDITKGTETSLLPAPGPWDQAVLDPTLSDIFVHWECDKTSAIL